ncbi:MAG: FAD binding domain-containing protein [Desulfobacterales bacterium]
MRIRPFDYWEAPGLDEALNELQGSGPDVKVIAGGTDLVLNMKKKKILPRRVISLHNLSELDFVRTQGSEVRIGALSRHADIAAHPWLKNHLPIICEAVGLIGSWQIRNVGTIGGNLCNASPCADSAPALLALNYGAWTNHPFHPANNVTAATQVIAGEPNGLALHTLAYPAMWMKP